MPPRHTYWTILFGNKPTAFRSATQEELLPTFKQIQAKHPDAVMMWFARGRLWRSEEESRAAFDRPRFDRPRGPLPESQGRSSKPAPGWLARVCRSAATSGSRAAANGRENPMNAHGSQAGVAGPPKPRSGEGGRTAEATVRNLPGETGLKAIARADPNRNGRTGDRSRSGETSRKAIAREDPNRNGRTALR